VYDEIHFVKGGVDSKLFQNLPRSKSGICDNQIQSKSKIPDFERERIEMVNHCNPGHGGISRIDDFDPTQLVPS